MTVICVDNMPIMLQSLKENADKAYPGADVQPFLSAESALDYAKKYGCDVLLCEINPPRLEGLFLAEKIQKNQPEGEYHLCYRLLGERTRKGGPAAEAQRIFNQGSHKCPAAGRTAQSAVSGCINHRCRLFQDKEG